MTAQRPPRRPLDREYRTAGDKAWAFGGLVMIMFFIFGVLGLFALGACQAWLHLPVSGLDALIVVIGLSVIVSAIIVHRQKWANPAHFADRKEISAEGYTRESWKREEARRRRIAQNRKISRKYRRRWWHRLLFWR